LPELKDFSCVSCFACYVLRMNQNNGILIADTPAKVAAYRLLALKGALKLETKGLQMSRGVRASVIARDELKKAGKPAPANKVKLLEAFEAYLREIGVLIDAPAKA
jgi:hypothetical protein